MITMEIIQTDATGNLCIPEKIFHALGLKPGMKFQIKTQGNAIILMKIDDSEDMTEEEMVQNMMSLSEYSLKEFLGEEPDFYSEADLKVKYE
jgi:bifunctional DNA-binding transcriptional regulator/antitoxin component of YhaV-PrlF toxin-antitoxin module